MNHYKIFIFTMILMVSAGNTLCFAELERSLTPTEVHTLENNIKKNPHNLKSRLFLGSHYYSKKQWRQTITVLSPIAEKLPDSGIFQLSSSFLQVNETRQAQDIANILLSRDEISVKSYLLAVDVYSEILTKTANTIQKKIIQDKLFGTLKYAKHKYPKSLKIYDRWLSALEDHVEHYAFDALRVMDDMEKNKIALKPRHLSLSCKYNHMAKFTKETKFACQKAIVKDPNNPANYIYLGQTHVNVGDDKVGKRMLASVGKKFSKSHDALYAAADSYYQSKNLGEAYKLFKKANDLPGASSATNLGLARAAFDLKKYDVALKAFTAHCHKEKYLHHEFRRSSGLLKNQPLWQSRFRQRMMDCQTR